MHESTGGMTLHNGTGCLCIGTPDLFIKFRSSKPYCVTKK